MYNSDKLEIVMTRGRWHIINEPATGWSYPSLVHYCYKNGTNPRAVYYIDYTYPSSRRLKPAWRCGGCWKRPPESILTVYLLFNWDEACKEINDIE